MGIREKIKELEDELARTQKNKATEYHIGIVKSKLAKLRREVISPTKHGAGGGGFDVKKSGNATVAIIGLPSVGKSTLLNKITNAESETASYAFTTLKCIPGILEYKQAKIQILDLPGIIEGAKDGKGRGREIISVARNADLILVMIEAGKPWHQKVIESELYGFGIRINTAPPNVVIKKLEKNGITINSTCKLTKITENEINAVLNEYRMYNANVVLRQDVSLEEFIDVIEGNRAYVPAVYVVSKSDTAQKKDLEKFSKDFLLISSHEEPSIDELKETIYQKLRFIKIFTKKRKEKADLEEPMIIKSGAKISDVCSMLHRELKANFRYALVWGKSVKHPAQRVGLEHTLMDGDIVQIVKR
jgi:small GTP-binding protein